MYIFDNFGTTDCRKRDDKSMGLFGFFATLLSGGVYVAEDLKETNYTSNKREQARIDGKVTYTDGKGKDYLTSTGEQVYIQGGKAYSLKNTGQVLYDMNKAYYMEENQKALNEAKEKGKKYISFYYHPNPESSSGYSSYKTEISTMKPFRLSYDVIPCKGYHWVYYKEYITGSGKFESLVTIDEKEFEELGGYRTICMTPEEYFYKKMEERDKEMKKMMRRFK